MPIVQKGGGTVGQKDIAIEMSFKLSNTSTLPELKKLVAKGMWHGMKFFKTNFERLIMAPLIFGGAGFKSIEQYAAWKWINSEERMAQLGFASTAEPIKLLLALMNSYELQLRGNPKAGGKSTRMNVALDVKMFDIDDISRQLMHPAAGKLGLASDRSWFDWVYKGRAISEPAKFTKTGPKQGARSSIIAGSEAGLMTDIGTGLWSVPPRYRLDLDLLFTTNEEKILQVMSDTIATQTTKYLNG